MQKLITEKNNSVQPPLRQLPGFHKIQNYKASLRERKSKSSKIIEGLEMGQKKKTQVCADLLTNRQQHDQ